MFKNIDELKNNIVNYLKGIIKNENNKNAIELINKNGYLCAEAKGAIKVYTDKEKTKNGSALLAYCEISGADGRENNRHAKQFIKDNTIQDLLSIAFKEIEKDKIKLKEAESNKYLLVNLQDKINNYFKSLTIKIENISVRFEDSNYEYYLRFNDSIGDEHFNIYFKLQDNNYIYNDTYKEEKHIFKNVNDILNHFINEIAPSIEKKTSFLKMYSIVENNFKSNIDKKILFKNRESFYTATIDNQYITLYEVNRKKEKPIYNYLYLKQFIDLFIKDNIDRFIIIDDNTDLSIKNIRKLISNNNCVMIHEGNTISKEESKQEEKAQEEQARKEEIKKEEENNTKKKTKKDTKEIFYIKTVNGYEEVEGYKLENKYGFELFYREVALGNYAVTHTPTGVALTGLIASSKSGLIKKLSEIVANLGKDKIIDMFNQAIETQGLVPNYNDSEEETENGTNDDKMIIEDKEAPIVNVKNDTNDEYFYSAVNLQNVLNNIDKVKLFKNDSASEIHGHLGTQQGGYYRLTRYDDNLFYMTFTIKTYGNDNVNKYEKFGSFDDVFNGYIEFLSKYQLDYMKYLEDSKNNEVKTGTNDTENHIDDDKSNIDNISHTNDGKNDTIRINDGKNSIIDTNDSDLSIVDTNDGKIVSINDGDLTCINSFNQALNLAQYHLEKKAKSKIDYINLEDINIEMETLKTLQNNANDEQLRLLYNKDFIRLNDDDFSILKEKLIKDWLSSKEVLE